MAQFEPRITVADDYSVLSETNDYGQLAVGTSAKDVTLGTITKEARTTLFIQANKDNAGDIFVGTDNLVTSIKHFASLSPGEKLEFILSTSNAPDIFVIGSDASDKIQVLETIGG